MTAIACAPAAQPPTQPAVIAAPADTADQPANDDEVVPDNSARRGDTTRPSMDFPPGIDEATRDLFAWLFSNTRNAERQARSIEQKLPSCTAGLRDCDPQWRSIAREYYTFRQVLRDAEGPPPDSSTDTAFLARVDEHRKYVKRLADDVDTLLTQAIDMNGEYWLGLLEDVRRAQSMPCLSPARP